MNSFIKSVNSKPAIFLVTRNCTRKCAYCSNEFNDTLPSAPYADTEKANQMIKQLSEFGFSEIVFTGGEPLLYKPLPRLISYAKSFGIKSVVFTTGDNIELLNKAKVWPDKIRLSIPDMVYADSKEVCDNLLNSISNILKLARKNNSKLDMNIILSSKNIKLVNHLNNWAQNESVSFKFQPLYLPEDHKEFKISLKNMSIEDWDTIESELVESTLNDSDKRYVKLWIEYFKLKKKPSCSCPLGPILVIEPDFKVRHCLFVDKVTKDFFQLSEESEEIVTLIGDDYKNASCFQELCLGGWRE
jgi:MoaA/NifB/PqqE/SkfB family radical SAM enzyme